MRELTSHKVNGLNEALEVVVIDEPGPGGACHDYAIRVPLADGVIRNDQIMFQNGPIAEAGINGSSNEAILAVLIDRMQGFQSGAFSCRENAVALTHLETAMMWMQKRTRDRMARGVEGTMQK